MILNAGTSRYGGPEGTLNIREFGRQYSRKYLRFVTKRKDLREYSREHSRLCPNRKSRYVNIHDFCPKSEIFM